jgi:hypothetical protein
MKIQSKKFIFFLITSVTLGITACGAEEENHFDDKEYGKNSGDITSGNQPEDETITIPQSPAPTTPVPAVTTTTEETEGGTDIVVGEDEEEGESEGDGLPEITPDTIISHANYGFFFDDNSIVGIDDNQGYKNLGGVVLNNIKGKLYEDAADRMLVAQTFGDGISKSLGWQDITLTAADGEKPEGADSTSGIQYIDRITGNGCPSVFLCIERMVFVPAQGNPATFCYTDMEGNRVPFPYSIIPNYAEADFAFYMGEYGPYLVEKYPGEDIDCDDPGVESIISEEITINVESGDVNSHSWTKHLFEPMPMDFAVIFNYNRVANDLVSPYIDETVLLNTKQEYVIDDNANEIAKMVINSRSTLNLSGFESIFVSVEGIAVDLHFEYCENLLDTTGFSHCVAPTED